MFYSFVTISIVVGLCFLLGKIVTQKLLNPVFCSEKRGFFYGEKFMSNSLLMQITRFDLHKSDTRLRVIIKIHTF